MKQISNDKEFEDIKIQYYSDDVKVEITIPAKNIDKVNELMEWLSH